MKTKLTVAFIFLFASSMQAQWTNDSLLNTPVSIQNGSVYPHQATTSDGKTYICWFELSQPGNYNMMMQLLDVHGNKLWASNGLFIRSGTFYPSSCDLKTDNSDNALIALSDLDSTNQSVNVFKIDTDQNFLWGLNGVILHDTASTWEGIPQLVVFSNNDIVVEWNSDFSGIVFQKISASGLTIWPQPKHVVPIVGSGHMAGVIAMNNQNFAIAYTDTLLKAMLYDSTGTSLWSAPVLVSTYSSNYTNPPFLAKDNSGGLYVTFLSGTMNPNLIFTFMVQRISPKGLVNWGADGIEVSSVPGFHKYYSPNIFFRNSDNHLYMLVDIFDTMITNSNIVAQSFDTLGNKLFTANGSTLLPFNAQYHYTDQAWSDAGDGFIITYPRRENVSGNDNLMAIKMDYNGGLMWNGNLVTLCAADSQKYSVSIGDFKNNQSVIVWQDYRIDSGIYVQNIGKYGSLGLTADLNDIHFANILALNPNPICEVSTLSLELTLKSKIKISVLDVLGREILIIFEGMLQQGKYSFAIEKRKLRSGLYFLKIGDEVLKVVVE